MGLLKWQYVLLFYATLILSTISMSFAAGGFEYLPDESTLGLWHFDGGDIVDTSDNKVKGEVEGKAGWDANQELTLPTFWGHLKR